MPHLPHIRHHRQASHLFGGGKKAPTFSSLMAASGLLAWWKEGESAGTTLADATGNGHTATTNGTPTLGAVGPVRNDATTCIKFNGSTQYAVNDSNFGQGNEIALAYTVGAWVRPRSAAANQVIYAHNDVHGIIRGVNAAYNHLIVTKTPVATQQVSGGTLTVGAWQFVVGTYDGNSIRLYVDGALVGTMAVGALYDTLPHTPGGICYPAVGTPWDGWTGQTFVVARCMSDAEILALYAAGAKTMVSVTASRAAANRVEWLFDATLPGGNPGLVFGDVAALEVNAGGGGYVAPDGIVGFNQLTDCRISPGYSGGGIVVGDAYRIAGDIAALNFGSGKYLRVPSSGVLT